MKESENTKIIKNIENSENIESNEIYNKYKYEIEDLQIKNEDINKNKLDIIIDENLNNKEKVDEILHKYNDKLEDRTDKNNNERKRKLNDYNNKNEKEGDIIEEEGNNIINNDISEENNNSLEDIDLNDENDYNAYDYSMHSNPIDYKYGCAGLYNLGNTCYMNSSLQILKNIYPLTKYILLENKIKKGIIIKEYTNLLYNLISKKYNSVDASEFKKALSEYDEYFSGYQQKDCIKCITSILSALNNDLKRKEIINNYKILNKNDKEEIVFNELYNKIIKRKNSIIFDIFYGFLKLSSKCTNKKCNYKNITFQCFNYLDLSLYDITENKKLNNLKECIKYYEREIISENKCEKCGNLIIMKNTIYKLPKILIINFNRVYNKYHLNYLVEYPEYFEIDKYFEEKPKLINISKTDNNNYYSLNGIIIHYGTANSGHKTAFCKNFFNNNWYYFNDDYGALNPDFLKESGAFILVYQLAQDYTSLDTIASLCDKNAKYTKTQKYYFYNKNSYFY